VNATRCRWHMGARATHDSEQVVEEDSTGNVDDTVCPQDTKVSPSVRVIDTETGKEDVRIFDSTELTVGSCSRVEQVSTGLRLVRTNVLLT
jgi:hypothetical protein